MFDPDDCVQIPEAYDAERTGALYAESEPGACPACGREAMQLLPYWDRQDWILYVDSRGVFTCRECKAIFVTQHTLHDDLETFQPPLSLTKFEKLAELYHAYIGDEDSHDRNQRHRSHYGAQALDRMISSMLTPQQIALLAVALPGIGGGWLYPETVGFMRSVLCPSDTPESLPSLLVE